MTWPWDRKTHRFCRGWFKKAGPTSTGVCDYCKPILTDRRLAVLARLEEIAEYYREVR